RESVGTSDMVLKGRYGECGGNQGVLGIKEGRGRPKRWEISSRRREGVQESASREVGFLYFLGKVPMVTGSWQ
ncbi:MAG: hypothetical protein AAGJ31_09405, partial [Verrucomicrobiota bacterium]